MPSSLFPTYHTYYKQRRWMANFFPSRFHCRQMLDGAISWLMKRFIQLEKKGRNRVAEAEIKGQRGNNGLGVSLRCCVIAWWTGCERGRHRDYYHACKAPPHIYFSFLSLYNNMTWLMILLRQLPLIIDRLYSLLCYDMLCILANGGS